LCLTCFPRFKLYCSTFISHKKPQIHKKILLYKCNNFLILVIHVPDQNYYYFLSFYLFFSYSQRNGTLSSRSLSLSLTHTRVRLFIDTAVRKPDNPEITHYHVSKLNICLVVIYIKSYTTLSYAEIERVPSCLRSTWPKYLQFSKP